MGDSRDLIVRVRAWQIRQTFMRSSTQGRALCPVLHPLRKIVSFGAGKTQ